MRTAFTLDRTASEHRQAPPLPVVAPVIDVETDWHPAALVIRARRAMGAGELVRVRLRDSTVHTGRLVRVLDLGRDRDASTLAIELDSGATVVLGDVASIGPATARSRPRDRRDPRLAACAHALGYRGHCLTKSRRHSTTFKALREAREAFVRAQILARSRDATQRAIATADTEQRTATFECVGVGRLTAADAYLAASEAARARERRRIGREECRGEPRSAMRAKQWATEESPVGAGEGKAGHDG